MFCEKCGNQLPDEAMFCDRCGAKVNRDEMTENLPESENTSEVVNTPEDVKTAEGAPTLSQDAQPVTKESTTLNDAHDKSSLGNEEKTPKGAIPSAPVIIAAACVVLLIIVIFAVGSRLKKNKGKEDSTQADMEESGSYESGQGEAEGQENDSSSDETAKPSEEFDPFEGVEVIFHGTAPDGNAEINLNGAEGADYDLIYDLDRDTGLRNGDVVKLSITSYSGEDVEEYLKKQFSKKPTAVEKEYTVEGLAWYVEKLADIPDSLMDRMKNQAEETYTSRFVNDWQMREEYDGDANDHRRSKIENLVYVGNYLLTKKLDGAGNQNVLILVYRPTIDIDWVRKDMGEEYKSKDTIYWAVSFYDIVIDQDGVAVADLNNYSVTENRLEFQTGFDGRPDYDLWGYTHYDDFYRDYISANLEYFNHEDNVDQALLNGSDITSGQSDMQSFESGSSGDYILPGSSTTYLSDSDLEKLSENELKIARNEIYARHGRKFNDEELQRYFDGKSWYEGSIEPDDFEDKKILNDYELKNLDLIVKAEKNR